jgi:hypothetical protein
MYELINFESKEKFSSLYLVEQINIYREAEGNRAVLRHSDFLAKFEIEFEDDIQERKISSLFYIKQLPNGGRKEYKYYELNVEQSLQILASESKMVRKQVIAKMKDQQKRILELEAEKTRLGSRYNPIKPGDQFDNRSYEANKDLFEANPGKFQDAVMHTDNRQDAEINYLKTELFELKFKYESLLKELHGGALKALPASTIGYYTIKEYRLKFKPNIPDTYSNSYIACLIKDHKLKEICGVVYGIQKEGVYTYKNLDKVFKWIVKMQKGLPAPAPTKGKRPGDANQLRLAM